MTKLNKNLCKRIYRSLSGVLIIGILAAVSSCNSPRRVSKTEDPEYSATSVTDRKSPIKDNRSFDEMEASDIERAQNALNEKIKNIPQEKLLDRLYEMAFKECDPDALYAVGGMHLCGINAPRNDQLALTAFGLAASKGHGRSLHKLAEIYAHRMDDDNALRFSILTYCYTSLAASFGEESARVKALKLEECLAPSLSPMIIDKIQKFITNKYLMILGNNRKYTVDEIRDITVMDQTESEVICRLIHEKFNRE